MKYWAVAFDGKMFRAYVVREISRDTFERHYYGYLDYCDDETKKRDEEQREFNAAYFKKEYDQWLTDGAMTYFRSGHALLKRVLFYLYKQEKISSQNDPVMQLSGVVKQDDEVFIIASRDPASFSDNLVELSWRLETAPFSKCCIRTCTYTVDELREG